MTKPGLIISTAPFLHEGTSTPRIMFEVFFALVPCIAAAVYFFGITALMLILVTAGSAMFCEWLFQKDRRGLGSLKDGSALLTGVLLALTLPPGIPLWMAALGGFIAIGMGKLIWGGLGFNVFNPALLGRAFLQAAFPQPMTTWTDPIQWEGGFKVAEFLHLQPTTVAIPFLQAKVDAVSSATPLGLAKFEGVITALKPLLWGYTGGCLGETAGLIILVAGLVLAIRRTFNWRLSVATLLGVLVFSAALHYGGVEKCPNPLFMLFSGGLMFGAVFMVTDPVTTPIAPRGMWIFGLGVGFLVVLIRVFGGLPEGVMFSILLMNAVTPHINAFTQPRTFGGGKHHGQ